MNSENPVSLTSIQRSWKRRVNVNTVYYFGIIICFSIMNFVLKTDVLKNLFDEHPIELKWHHWNGTLLADLRLISYLSFQFFRLWLKNFCPMIHPIFYMKSKKMHSLFWRGRTGFLGYIWKQVFLILKTWICEFFKCTCHIIFLKKFVWRFFFSLN